MYLRAMHALHNMFRYCTVTITEPSTEPFFACMLVRNDSNAGDHIRTTGRCINIGSSWVYTLDCFPRKGQTVTFPGKI